MKSSTTTTKNQTKHWCFCEDTITAEVPCPVMRKPPPFPCPHTACWNLVLLLCSDQKPAAISVPCSVILFLPSNVIVKSFGLAHLVICRFTLLLVIKGISPKCKLLEIGNLAISISIVTLDRRLGIIWLIFIQCRQFNKNWTSPLVLNDSGFFADGPQEFQAAVPSWAGHLHSAAFCFRTCRGGKLWYEQEEGKKGHESIWIIGGGIQMRCWITNILSSELLT